jgi:hypothetical protein
VVGGVGGAVVICWTVVLLSYTSSCLWSLYSLRCPSEQSGNRAANETRLTQSNQRTFSEYFYYHLLLTYISFSLSLVFIRLCYTLWVWKTSLSYYLYQDEREKSANFLKKWRSFSPRPEIISHTSPMIIPLLCVRSGKNSQRFGETYHFILLIGSHFCNRFIIQFIQLASC